VAKAVNNGKAQPKKGAHAGKPTQGGKASGKQGEAKPARGKAAQARSRVRGRSRERKSLRQFLHEVRIELGKVTWPTRKDLAQSTLVVLVAVAIATAYTGVLDVIFDRAIAFVVGLLT
jgi:preprotein translocase subunit SecE